MGLFLPFAGVTVKRGIWHPLEEKNFEKLQQEAGNCPRRKKSPTEKYSRADGNIICYIMMCMFILIAGISRLRELAFFDECISGGEKEL
jgi:hypothetical protein